LFRIGDHWSGSAIKGPFKNNYGSRKLGWIFWI